MAVTGSSLVTDSDKNLLPPAGVRPASERGELDGYLLLCTPHSPLERKAVNISRGEDTLGQVVCYCFYSSLEDRSHTLPAHSRECLPAHPAHRLQVFNAKGKVN